MALSEMQKEAVRQVTRNLAAAQEAVETIEGSAVSAVQRRIATNAANLISEQIARLETLTRE